CALTVALPAWFSASYWLLEGILSSVVAVLPVAAYVAWRITAELTEENDVGISRLDEIWVSVERHLPDAGVRRVAWRVVRTVVAMGVVAGVMVAGLLMMPKRQPPKQEAPAVLVLPTPEPEPVIEPRLVTGVFAT